MVKTTPKLQYGLLQHAIFIDGIEVKTKVNSLIDILKLILVYAEMTFYMPAHVWGKIRNWLLLPL